MRKSWSTALSRRGKTLEDVAKDLNVEVLTSDPLKRDGMAVYILPAAVQQAFTLPEGGYGSAPSGIGEGRIVFKVDKVTPPATIRRPKEAARLKAQIKLLIGDDAISEYFAALEKRYGVKRQREGACQARRHQRGAMSAAPASVAPLTRARRRPLRSSPTSPLRAAL